MQHAESKLLKQNDLDFPQSKASDAVNPENQASKLVSNSTSEPDLVAINGEDESGGMPVNRDWLMKTLSSALSWDGGPKLNAIKCERVGKDQGNLSFIGRVTMDWATDDHKLPKSIVLKVPTTDKCRDQMKSMNMTEKQAKKLDVNSYVYSAHNNECLVYKLFADNKTSIPLPMLKFYGAEEYDQSAQKTGYVLMEDLTQTSQTPDFFKGINEAQCREVVKAIAAFQAYGIVNQAWNKGLLEKAEMKKFFRSGQVDFILDEIRTVAPDIFTITKCQIFAVAFSALRCEMLNDKKLIATGKIHPVLAHGDMWTFNTLFHVDKSGVLTDSFAGLIDLQMVHPGSCTEDLVRLLVFSLDPDVRKRVEMDMLQFYYETLKQNLDHSGSGIAVPFSFKDVIKSYRNNFIGAALLLLIVTGFQLIKLKTDPTTKQDAETDKLKRDLVRRCAAALDEAYEYTVFASCGRACCSIV